MDFGSLGRSANQVMIRIKGDNKSFDSAVDTSKHKLSGFAASAKKYGPMIGVAFAAAAVGFIAMSVKMAAAEEVVNRQTESMLKSQGVMWSNVKDEITDYINELEALTAYGDTDLQMAFNRMISSGMSYKLTMESMNMVTDIAYTRNMDLVAAADLVSKAYIGQASSLKRYGIIVEAGVTGVEALNAVQVEVDKNFADAADRADTLEGKMDKLNTVTDDFSEAIGVELLPYLTSFVSLLVEGSDASESFATKLGKLIAIPFKEVTKAKTVENLAIELHELEMIQKRTADEERRRSEIIFEMQQRIAGTWAEYADNRIGKNVEFLKAEEDIITAEEGQYFIQLRKMGATEEYINKLKEQLSVEEQITNETKTQTTELEKQAAYKSKYGQSEGMRARSAGIDIGSLGIEGETRQSGAWTIGPGVITASQSGLY